MTCRCGGYIIVDHRGIAMAVYEHVRTATHRAWRWYQDQGR